ncbi:hypothetical protein L1987_83562 [Smallanthus sonchifolius]|uniref:Uncharacterized protein n=1 Tax=Smallanthus sonchifolius TaxID=185202 RepID=A0ACB8YCH1_9ASTR|nr:hypothetical protein L1987_83562 [Smallanthus sonchifolius]
MEAKLFWCFVVVLHLFTVAPFCYVSRSRLPVKSIKSPDGDIIDCVHISRQPAFSHPALKNHTIKMRPSYYPIEVSSMMNASKVSQEQLVQLWHSNGKCPKGTIPIIRTKNDDPLRANSVKKSSFVVQPSFVDYVHLGHEFYGAKATKNVWNPKVQERDEFSLAQLWLLAGSYSDMNTIEAGWQTLCVFVTSNQDPKEGDWWMHGEVLGYWPASVFTHLSESASMVYWGGEIINNNTHGHHTSTQMGSGHFPEEGFRKASYIKNIQ